MAILRMHSTEAAHAMQKVALTRRELLLGSAAGVSLAGLAANAAPNGASGQLAAESIRPFRAQVPVTVLVDLRQRISATRWPDTELVSDGSQGVPSAALRRLADYWATGYDWRKAEQKLNALPQFTTTLDGLDIHFIHVRSRHAEAMPMIMTHGWPGSVFELLKTVGPLTDPTAHGGRAEDAFHLVLPTLPGYGFSQKPSSRGWNPDRIARAWATLMARLGYTRYVAQGGDWGAIVCDAMGRQAPSGLAGMHVNRIERATTVPPEIAKALATGEPAPTSLSPDELVVFGEIKDFYKSGLGYASIMATRPQTIGYGLADSPVAMAAWFYDKIADWVFTRGEPERSLTRDELLDDITLYWVTNSGTSSARIYWEAAAGGAQAGPIAIPVAVTIFPGEVYKPPKVWTQRAYQNLIYYNRVDKGGHFAAWEEPLLFSAELRAAFRSLR